MSVGYYYRHYNTWLVLTVAVVADRLLLVLVIYMVAPFLNLHYAFMQTTALISGLPGIILMYLVIPFTIKKIEKYA